MKRKEELNVLKEKEKTLSIQHAELTEENLVEVAGGSYVRRSIVYIIKNGDTLPDIAGKYGITVNLLCELNNINPGDYINPGNKLLIPLK